MSPSLLKLLVSLGTTDGMSVVWGSSKSRQECLEKCHPILDFWSLRTPKLFRDNSLINLYLTELYILFMMVKVDPQVWTS